MSIDLLVYSYICKDEKDVPHPPGFPVLEN